MILFRRIYSKVRGYFIKLKYMKTNIGRNTYIDNTVQVHGWANLRIGENCTIGERTILTINNRAVSENQIAIGSNSYIGRNNFFSAGKRITMKEFTMTGNNCAFVSSNHVFENPDIPYALSGATEESIEIGVNCWIGIGVMIIGNVKVGHGSIIGANSLINKDIPPFCIVVGNPQRIVKRYDFKRAMWLKIDDESADFTQAPDEAKYLEKLKKDFPQAYLAYHSASARFGHL